MQTDRDETKPWGQDAHETSVAEIIIKTMAQPERFFGAGMHPKDFKVGNYLNLCMDCGEAFKGVKGQCTCRECQAVKEGMV